MRSAVAHKIGTRPYPVFDTNSVRTGDADANQISLDEILRRYGRDSSYLNFLGEALTQFVFANSGVLFIDSLKIANDMHVLKTMFSMHPQEIWYLHASFQTRLSRYLNRDIRTKLRTQNLEEHDGSLEKHGILSLIKNANEVINMELDLDEVTESVKKAIKRTEKMHSYSNPA